jgi:hypothetical protein
MEDKILKRVFRQGERPPEFLDRSSPEQRHSFIGQLSPIAYKNARAA